MNVGKNLLTFFILFQIYLDKMHEKLLTNIANKIRLSYLSSSINQ